MRKLCEKRSLLHGIYGWFLRGFIMSIVRPKVNTSKTLIPWPTKNNNFPVFIRPNATEMIPKSNMMTGEWCEWNEWASHLCWFIHHIKYGLKCANIRTFVDFDLCLCNLLFRKSTLSTHTYSQPPTSLVIKRSAIREWLLMPKMSRLNHGSLNVFIFSMTQQYMLRYRMASRYQLLDMNWKVESSNAVAQLVSEMNEKC